MITLEAPGSFFSGLLGVPVAGVLSPERGILHTLPQRSGWWLLGVLFGAVRVTAEDATLVLRAGQAAAFSGGMDVAMLPLEDARVGLICLEGGVARAVLEQERTRSGLFFDRGGEAVERTLRLWDAQRQQVSARQASEQAYELLMRLYGTGSAGPRSGETLPWVVEAALGIMRREYAFLDGIGELADRLEVSQEYLTRAFRSAIGITPGKYLNQVRLENAKLMLRQGEHSVAFISDACGFSNGNYFARVFRESTGMTPREYAQRQQEPPAGEMLNDSLYVL